MKQIQLEQGTKEWLSWRKTVITATDASIIMGNNPWTTPYKCWQNKLGLVEEQKTNDAMERGKKLEPEARAQFIQRYDLIMEPMVVESTEYEFLGASLDGICLSGRFILEIKCGGAKLHDLAARGEIPAYYLDQMQHQLLVTRAEKCFYYSYDGKEGICIEVLPDPEFIIRFMPKAREFWRNVAFSEPPAMTNKDYKDMTGRLSWDSFALEYRKTCEQIKNLEDLKESYRKELIKLCGEDSCCGSGIKVLKRIVKGKIDYDSIQVLKEIDLEKHRKPSSSSWMIMLE